MAESILLTGFEKDGSKQFELEPGWWRISELNNLVKIHWVESNETGSYRDLDADISVNDARQLHEQFKRYASDDDSKMRWEQLDIALRNDNFSRFHVRVFEWDTGMG